MNIKRAKQEIRDTIRAYLAKNSDGDYLIPRLRQRPLLLIGPPGIGKTQIVSQVASEEDLALVSYTITHHTRQSAIGLPFIRERSYGGQTYSVTQYTMSEIIASVYECMEASGKMEGILFIDEINCVSETLAPAMLQFLQYKTFGNREIPDGWIIVAAGNPPEYNRSVREFDTVTLDRVRLIPIEADFDAFREYAAERGIHSCVLSYLDLRRANFYRMETTVDGTSFATARGWEDLSELIRAYEYTGTGMERSIDFDVVSEYIQFPAVAQDFADYLNLYFKYREEYRIPEILDGHIPEASLKRLPLAPFDERIEVTALLLSGLTGAFREAHDEDACLTAVREILQGCLTSDGSGLDSAALAADREAAGTATAVESGGGVCVVSFTESTNTADDSCPASGTTLHAPTVLQALSGAVAAERGRLEQRIAAGQKERDGIRQSRRTIALLEEILRECGGAAADTQDGAVREAFNRQLDRAEEANDAISGRLEHAFDFMEAAFGESQEMVYFISQLNVSRYAVWFIREYDCPRYYRYNKSLLLKDRREELRAQIAAAYAGETENA